MPDSTLDDATKPQRPTGFGSYDSPYKVDLTANDVSAFINFLEAIGAEYDDIVDDPLRISELLQVVWIQMDVLDEESLKIYATHLQAKRILESIKMNDSRNLTWKELKNLLKSMKAIPLSGEERIAIKNQEPITWKGVNREYRRNKGLDQEEG